MNFKSVFTIVQLLIPAIQTAEEFIRGKGRGDEKRTAVIANFSSKVLEIKNEIKEVVGIDLKSFNWIKFALSSREFLAKVGVVVDAVVDLANYIESFDDVPEVVPPAQVN